MAYAGLVLFTVLLYLRPNDLLPIGTFPVVKLVGLGALAAFFFEQLGAHRPLSIMPIEFKYVLGLAALMILSAPFGLDPSTSLSEFADEFLKVLLIFMLMINVVTTFRRLRQMLEVTVVSGSLVAVITLVNFVRGQNLAEGFRAVGAVGGIFGNPNDLALALNILLPIAVGLAIGRRHLLLRVVYAGCAITLMAGVLVTYSRAGFLTLAITSAFLLLRLSRRYPLAWVFSLLGMAALLFLSPGGFWNRVLTLFDTSGDVSAAASAEIRWSLVQRSLEVAGLNPVRWLLGVGAQNFHMVSIQEKVSHNAYIQVFNELGLPALVIYVLLLGGVIHATDRIVRAYDGVRGHRHIWTAALAIEASLISYAVGSVFASVAYLWYLYYAAGFAVCLKQLVLASVRSATRTEVPPRVWNLRRLRH